MNHIKLLVLFMLCLQATIYAAQESKQDYEQELQAMIDGIVRSHLDL